MIEHSNARSKTHEKDKIRFNAICAQKAKDAEAEEEIIKISEMVLSESGLRAHFKFCECEDFYLIKDGDKLVTSTGQAYEAFLKSESKKRKYYRSPKGKLESIDANSGLELWTLPMLPGQSAYVRTLPAQQQQELLSELAVNRADQISDITGWLVLGIAYHDDTGIIHFDYMLSRYSAPQTADQSPRNREDACKLLGDRKGLRKVGPCVTAYFRYSADGHDEIARPGLRDDAIRKLKAHQRRYKGEVALDVQAALALDQEVRDRFSGIPDFDIINREWYLARARIQRKMAVKKLNDLLAHEHDRENTAETITTVTSLLNGYVHNGLSGLQRRLLDLYREGVVADKQIIADALKQFGSVVKSLPEADQKELVQLIIREVSVKHFDPETDPTPKENGVFKTKIRTKWYLVNISLFASDLFPAGLQTREISSDLKRIGSRGRTRTFNHTINSRVLYH